MSDKIDDGGPAFPIPQQQFTDGVTIVGTEGAPGMSLRDWFATHCPEAWVQKAMPGTIGEMRDALISRGIISELKRNGDALKSYTEADVLRLMAALRYEYADAMLTARRESAQ